MPRYTRHALWFVLVLTLALGLSGCYKSAGGSLQPTEQGQAVSQNISNTPIPLTMTATQDILATEPAEVLLPTRETTPTQVTPTTQVIGPTATETFTSFVQPSQFPTQQSVTTVAQVSSPVFVPAATQTTVPPTATSTATATIPPTATSTPTVPPPTFGPSPTYTSVPFVAVQPSPTYTPFMPPQQQQQAVPMAERPTETLVVGDQGGQQAVVMPSATPAEVAMLQATLSPIQMTSTVVVYNATATAAALMGQPLQPQGQQPVQQASPIFQTTPIPGTTPLVTPIPGQTCGSHLVSPGDNLFRIALSYNVTVDQMALANNIVNPDLILAGATLIVPCPLPASATTTTTTTTAVTTTGQGGLSAGNTYIVEPGDTLYRISLQYGVSMSALMQANGLTPATINMIYAGDQLVIPVGATTTVQPTAFPTAAIQQQQQQPVSPIG